MNLSSAPGLGASTTTLTDLINRTYHLGFTYQSPYSPLRSELGAFSCLGAEPEHD